MASITSAGIGSGLDVNSIVTQLMTIEQQPLNDLKTKEAGYQAKISAYGTLKGSLSSFQNSLSSLSNVTSLTKLTTNVSDPNVLTATTATNASAGSYSINVGQLAQAQSLSAAGQADPKASIGSGATTTISFDFGSIAGGSLSGGVYTGASFTANPNIASGSLTIDASNNSLIGIRDAINNASLGVTAAIVNDGSATPYRLVLTSSKTGAASSVKISVSGDASLGSLLANDPTGTQNLVQAQVAQDANLTVNGLAITSASNTVSNTLQGVTLNLLKTGTASLNTSLDQTAIKTAVQGFVSAYNDTAKTLSGLTAYDASTKQGGLLLGDSTTQRIQSSIRGVLTSAIQGNGYTTLSQIGVAFQKDGALALDSNKLQTALTANPTAVASLFATSGKTTDALVTYIGSTSSTIPGTYGVNISSVATQGSAVGSTPLGTTTVIDGSNDALTFTLDGVASSVTLAHGSYNQSQIAAQIQSAINGANLVKGTALGVTVTQSAGLLTLRSNSYGSSSSLTLGGNAVAALLGTATSTSGTSLAGTIGGNATTASGQTLLGTNGSTQGLSLLVSGGATGNRGTVTITQGLSSKLNALLDGMLTTKGLIASRTDGLQRSITDIGKKEDALNSRLTAIEARYRAQFNALDTTISSLKNTSTFLTQQLATLNGSKNSSN